MSDENVVLADNAAMSVREAAQAFEALLAEESGEQAPERRKPKPMRLRRQGTLKRKRVSKAKYPKKLKRLASLMKARKASNQTSHPLSPSKLTVRKRRFRSTSC